MPAPSYDMAFQHFRMEPDELGQTSICDVSEKDAQVLRQLNLLEVTSLFDEHNISWTRLRGRRKYKGKTRNPVLANELNECVVFKHDVIFRLHF